MDSMVNHVTQFSSCKSVVCVLCILHNNKMDACMVFKLLDNN